MTDTPSSTSSKSQKSLNRSAKSVSFSGNSEYIPPPDYLDDPVPDLPKHHRFSAPPVPYFHAPDDFPVEDNRCWRHRYLSGQSDVTLVESIKDFEREIEKRWSNVSSITTFSSHPARYTLSKGDIVGADEIDLEKQHLPEISVVQPITRPDSYTVKFDGPKDPLNPKNWPSRQKWRMTICVASFTFLAPLTSSMPAPGLEQIARQFRVTSDIETQMLLSIFVLAFAIGPVIFGPLSELYGRVVILQAANVIFLGCTIGCGFAQSELQMMIFRFFAGFGGSAPLAIGGGVLGDLFLPQERGKAMAIYGMGPLLGPSIGPIVGSFVSAYSTWRWMFWAASGASAVVLAVSFIFMKESYAPVLLERKATALRESTGIDFYQTETYDPNKTIIKSISSTLIRALKMLFTQPIVLVMAWYMAYAYGTMYLVLATFPNLWRDVYHESATMAGLNYLSLGLGFFIGAPITGKGTDKIYRHLTAKHAKNENPRDPPQPSMLQLPMSGAGGPLGASTITTPSALPKSAGGPQAGPPLGPPGMGPPGMGPPGPRGKPEYRLPLIIPFSLLPPIGLFLYGWSAEYRLHWIFPNVGAFLFALGTVAAFQSVTAYLIDAYTRRESNSEEARILFQFLNFYYPASQQELAYVHTFSSLLMHKLQGIVSRST
ncbi:putative mfs multidrug [Phaeomoniella chlamydospora]|uniref:Putative mfs multidrug n=1 Tax=Phaeomoniella chlamydospora TaxID=158046 RepID=A0A0G2EGE0_PHACM|nr:putative mfs multidrug [Phaeomoniella chlamydospora]